MIEVFNKKKKKVGYIEGIKYYNRKHKLIGYLEGDAIKNKEGCNILRLDKHDDILFNNEQVGFILNSKIYFRENPIFEFSREKRELHTSDGKQQLIIEGNHEKLNELNFFAIATIFLKSKWYNMLYNS